MHDPRPVHLRHSSAQLDRELERLPGRDLDEVSHHHGVPTAPAQQTAELADPHLIADQDLDLTTRTKDDLATDSLFHDWLPTP